MRLEVEQQHGEALRVQHSRPAQHRKAAAANAVEQQHGAAMRTAGGEAGPTGGCRTRCRMQRFRRQGPPAVRRSPPAQERGDAAADERRGEEERQCDRRKQGNEASQTLHSGCLSHQA